MKYKEQESWVVKSNTIADVASLLNSDLFAIFLLNIRKKA